jgi:hypothetical protein
MKLWVVLGTHGEHEVDAEVRWATPTQAGVEFVHLDADTARVLQRFVAELMERGASG